MTRISNFIRRLSDLPEVYQEAWEGWKEDYWPVEFPENPAFQLRWVPLEKLELAQQRPLKLAQLDMRMKGQTKTEGPLMLDSDFSVIDGMHRLADLKSRAALRVKAWVRI